MKPFKKKLIIMRCSRWWKHKYFVCLTTCLIIILVFCAIYMYALDSSIYIGFLNKNNANIFPISEDLTSNSAENPDRPLIRAGVSWKNQKQSALKYILQWTNSNTVPFKYMGVGQQVFVDKKCAYTNCFVTADKNYFSDYTEFDVIAFAGPQVSMYKKALLPQRRSPYQKYVFGTIESAANYPICPDYFDGFFNWTWTYRLDSESRWGYIVVRDKEDKIVGPNITMHWIKHEEMLPASDELKEVLRGKKKAAAWFVSNCRTRVKRGKYVNKLNKVLKSKYNLSVDIYGRCGKLTCKKNVNVCHEMIKKDYFFYLSFENSFSEDYVTEKLVHAVGYNAIPIVYGGANYSRFLPDGSYLNARELDYERLAAKMNELIMDFDQYAEYFRWTNHYRYHRTMDSSDTDDYCSMCTVLNDEKKFKEVSTLEALENGGMVAKRVGILLTKYEKRHMLYFLVHCSQNILIGWLK